MHDHECEKHYIGETGTIIYINCGEDVSSATNVSVLLERPDGTIVQRTATPVTYRDSVNYIVFIIEEGDFNQEGDYTGQVELTLGSWNGKGKEFTIHIDEGLSSSSSSSKSSSYSSSSSSSSSSS